MQKIKFALTSRTVWTIVALFLFNGITAIKDSVPPNYQPYVELVLSGLAIYFRINPTQ